MREAGPPWSTTLRTPTSQWYQGGAQKPQVVELPTPASINASCMRVDGGSVDVDGSPDDGGNYMRDIREWQSIIDGFKSGTGELVIKIYMAGGDAGGAAGVVGCALMLRLPSAHRPSSVRS